MNDAPVMADVQAATEEDTPLAMNLLAPYAARLATSFKQQADK
jgi:hypothetical protein